MVRKSRPREEKVAELANGFLVGCDPEAVILDSSGRLVMADQYTAGRHNVGIDHGGSVLEFRPKPFKGTYSLVKELQRLIHSVQIPHRVRAGAYVRTMEMGRRANVTLGGHIHLDVDNREDPGLVERLDRNTKYLEKLDILPAAENESRKALSQYGRYSDIRHAYSSEGRRRIEYRSMPSWLYSPVAAFTCLTTSKLAVIDKDIAESLNLNQISFNKYLSWLEKFKTKDINARRLIEKLIEKRGLKGLQTDPDADVRHAWEGRFKF